MYKTECKYGIFQIKQAVKLKDATHISKTPGPCARKLDEVLKLHNVERQAYFGKTFVGNHINKMLKVRLTNFLKTATKIFAYQNNCCINVICTYTTFILVR